MKYGTRGRMEWEDRRETICMWERVGRKVGNGKIKVWKLWYGSMEKENRKISIGNWRTLGKLEVWEMWKNIIEIRGKELWGGGGCKNPKGYSKMKYKRCGT